MSAPDLVIHGSNIGYSWRGKTHPTLNIPSFQIRRGSHTFLKGPSGSGKSTLLGLIAGVLPVQSGTLNVLGSALETASPQERDNLRSTHMGVIFQQFNLLPFLDVGANITLPCNFSKERAASAISRSGSIEKDAKRLLERLNMPPDALWSSKVKELSVGQQQRVAVARAMIGAPSLIIADEPTSAMDTNNRNAFITLLNEEAERSASTLLFVSHDESLASSFDEVLDLEEINTVSVESAA